MAGAGSRSTTPEALLERWRRRRDPEALGALFDATAPALFRVALAVLGDPNQAEDALQETFLTLLEHADGHDGTRPVTPWLVGILRNHARALRRRAARAPDPRRLPARSDGASAPDAAERGSEDRVRETVDGFEEPYRSVGLLHWCYGLSPAEIAHIRGEPPGTTRSTLSRARRRLREGHPEGAALFGLGATPQGLAAVRAELLRHAGSRVAASAAIVTGGLVMKKVLLGVSAVVAVALLAWFGPWWRAGERSPRGVPEPRAEASEDRLDPSADAPELAGRSAPQLAAPPRRAHVVRGIVVDGAGAPVPDARLFAVPADHTGGAGGRVDVLDTSSEGARSDGQGRFEIEVPKDTKKVDLQVVAEAYAPDLTRDVPVAEDVRVVLGRPPRLVGRVLDVDERPVPGARVGVRGLLGALPFERDVAVDDDGAYGIDLPPGPGELIDMRGTPLTWHLTVEAEGYPRLLRGGANLGVLGRAVGGRTYRRDFVLHRGGTFSGHVLEAGTTRPVPHARVVVWNLGGLLTVSFGDGRRAILDDTPRTLGRTTTDDDGRFEIEGLSAGVGAWAAASKAGRATTVASITTPDDGGRLTRDFVLRPTGRIEGRVLGPDGGPGQACRVVAYAEAPAYLSQAFLEPPSDVGAAAVTTTTKADGTYVLPFAPAGVDEAVEVTVVVNPLGPLGGSTFEQRRVELCAGGVATAPDVRIGQPAGAWLRARLRVLGADGSPLRAAEVAQSLIATLHRSDEEGLVDLEWARAGGMAPPQAFIVRALGHAPTLVDVTYAEGEPETIDVRLGRGHVLRGRVLYGDGAPAPGVRVRVADGRTSADRVLSDLGRDMGGLQPDRKPTLDLLGHALTEEDGSFRVGKLPAGPYHVEASAKRGSWGVRPEPARLRIVKTDVQGPDQPLELVLPEDDTRAVGRVQGRAVGERGRSIAGVRAWLEGEAQEVGADRTGPGRFGIAAAPAGIWTLHVEAPGRVPYEEAGLDVKEGRTTEVNVVLDDGVTVEGQALDVAGKPLVDHEVGLSPVGSKGWRRCLVLTAVRPDGSFDVAGLAPGVWRVAAAPRGQFTSRSAVAVPEGDALLRIPPGEAAVRFERAFVAAGRLSIGVGGDQWPRPLAFGVSTAEQTAFGRASRIVVLDATGGVLVDHRGLCGGGHLGEAADLVLQPGTYVVRLESPAGTKEQSIEVASGGRARVYFESP